MAEAPGNLANAHAVPVCTTYPTVVFHLQHPRLRFARHPSLKLGRQLTKSAAVGPNSMPISWAGWVPFQCRCPRRDWSSPTLLHDSWQEGLHVAAQRPPARRAREQRSSFGSRRACRNIRRAEVSCDERTSSSACGSDAARHPQGMKEKLKPWNARRRSRGRASLASRRERKR